MLGLSSACSAVFTGLTSNVSLIYLDYNRTTPIASAVLDAMKPYWTTHYMLPSQDHAQAQAVSEALENARESIGQLVGCEPFELVFTSGGTESNNLAIRGMAGQAAPGHLLTTEVEHDSVLGPASRSARPAGRSNGFRWMAKDVLTPTTSRIESPTRLGSPVCS